MEIKAYLKNLKISPKKLRFLVPAIKKMTPEQALNHLLYTPKKGAQIFYKAIKSALANAKNLGFSEDILRFKTLLVEEGRKIKRYRPGSKGMVKPRKKRYSHIKIILEKISSPLISNSKKQPVPKKLFREESSVSDLELKKKEETGEKDKKKTEAKKLAKKKNSSVRNLIKKDKNSKIKGETQPGKKINKIKNKKSK